MEMVNIIINGQNVTTTKNTTVLAAARQAGIEIPTLCCLKDVNEVGSCRVCVVELNSRLIASCTLMAEEGII